MGEERSAQWYDAVYSDPARWPWSERPAEDAPWAPIWRRILEHIHPNDSVLDLGCGCGQLADLRVARDGPESSWLGVDFSWEAVKAARRRSAFSEKQEFWQGDLLVAAMHWARSDSPTVVVLSEVLEHIENDREVLQALPRSMRVVFSVPNHDSDGHVRWFANADDVRARYASVVDDLVIEVLENGGRLYFIGSGVAVGRHPHDTGQPCQAGDRMRKLVVLVALWHRHDLAQQMLEHTLAIARECSGFDVEVHAIVSPDEDPESLTLATALGVSCTAAPNQPLGAKWNAGMRTLSERETPPDAVMILGSDDFVTVEILRAAACAIFEEKVALVGFLDFFFLTHGPRAAYWPGYSEESGRKGETIGTARTFSRRLLDILKWTPWPGHAAKGLDGASWAKVQVAQHFFDEVTVKALSCIAVGGMILDVKPAGSKAISSVESYFAESAEIDWTVIASRFPVELMAAWNLDPLPEFAKRQRVRVTEGQVRLALTMIAKNAEGTIERAIRTALPVIDDGVVVVDDRTSDRTEDVARALGMTVARRAWEGFGAQRRFVHEIAGYARWHLVLDADETLEPGNLLEAIDQAEREDADAVLVTLLAQTQGGTIPQMQVRVLRAGRARWVFRRHNDLRGVKKTVLSTAVVHQSYVGVVADRASASIPDLLEMWENPSEPGVPESEERAHAACFLSQAYGALGDWPAVELWTSRCMALDPDKKYPEAAARWALARALTLHTDALPDIHAMIEKYPGMADLEHLAGSLHLARWFLGCVNPGRYANRAQTTMPYLRNAQSAFEALGFALSFREPTEAEAAAAEKAGRAQA